MFYCEECRITNEWPQSMMRWRSVCEVCNFWSADCNDIQSSALTPVKRSDAASHRTSTEEK